jgi:hypothetical protein
MRFCPSSIYGVGRFGIVLLAFACLAPQSASGQLWLQTARVVTPVEQGPVRVMLDSLVSVMERRDIEGRRSPEAPEMTVAELRNELIDEEQIGLSGANHAFIDYRFSIGSGTPFQQQVSKIHFVFRPGPNQADVPVLYLDMQLPWVDQFLHNKGTSLSTNEPVLIPFQQHLGFAQIARPDETQIVELAGRPVREGFQEEKETLIRKVERLTYK